MAAIGFRPYQNYGSRDAGHVREFPILANYGTSIFYGDPVAMTTDGTIDKAAGADIDNGDCVGIFIGCQYDDANGRPTFSHHYPASQNVEGIVASVVTNPEALFKVRILNGTGGDDTMLRPEIGLNYDMDTTNAGSTVTGNSGTGLDATSGVTAVAQWRLIDLVNDVDGPKGAQTATTTYTHGIVMLQPTLHFHRQVTGI